MGTNQSDPRGLAQTGRKQRPHLLVALGSVILAALLPGAPVAQAADGFVGCGDAQGLRAAVAAANALPGPDTISLKKGCTYKFSSPVPFTDAAMIVTGDLTVYGNGAKIVRSSKGADMRHFDVTGVGTSLRLNNVSLKYGRIASPHATYPAAGSILVATGSELAGDKLTVERNAVKAIFEAGDVSAAGGILNDGGTVTLKRSAVKRNKVSATVGGGSVVLGGGMVTTGTGSTSLSRTVVKENEARTFGGPGPISIGGGAAGAGPLLTMTIDDSTVTANKAVVDGDAALGALGAGGLAMTGTTILNGTDVDGNEAKAKNVIGEVVLSGGISNSGQLSVDLGGDSDERTELTDNELYCPDEGCTARGGAFAQLTPAATSVFRRTAIKDNTARSPEGLAFGGAVYVGAGTVDLDEVIVKRNRAVGEVAKGGGIYATPAAVVTIGVSDVFSNTPQNCTGVLGC